MQNFSDCTNQPETAEPAPEEVVKQMIEINPEVETLINIFDLKLDK